MSNDHYPIPIVCTAELKDEFPPLERQSIHSQTPVRSIKAWLSVLAGFLGFFIASGPASGFGSFQDYYQRELLSQSSPSNVSWIGSVNAFLLVGTGVCFGPLFYRGYGRTIICVGCIAVVFGMIMLSLSRRYYQVMLSHGICVGSAAGIIHIPMLAWVNVNFVGTKRAIANGVVASGGNVGGIIFPIVFLRLLPRIGFAWTVRVLGFIQLGCVSIIIPIIFMVPFPRTTAIRSLVHWDAFRQPTFTFYAIFNFLVMNGYFVPIVYIPIYAVQRLNIPQETGMYLLAGLNAGSEIGRVGSLLITEKIGAANMLFGATTVCGISLLAWISITNLAGIVVISIIFGVFSGILVTTMPLVAVHLLNSPHPDVIGTRMGMLWFTGGLGILIGPPIAGSLISVIPVNQFVGLQIFSGAVILGALFFLSLAVAVSRYYSNSTAS